jgi:hypothetical protein
MEYSLLPDYFHYHRFLKEPLMACAMQFLIDIEHRMAGWKDVNPALLLWSRNTQ